MRVFLINRMEIRDFSQIGSRLFERLYLQIRDILNWQLKQKQKHILLPENVEKKTFSYCEELPNIRQGNLYLSKDVEDTRSMPLIVDIHGGGWIHGDKDIYDDYNAELVKKGYAVSSLTYRTIDHVNMIDQVQDIFAYLHYLKDHQDELGISMDQVVITGDSAGAQLSLLCYSINQSPHLQEVFGVKPVDINFSALALTHPVCFIDQAGKLPKSQWLSNALTIPGLQEMLYGPGFHKLEAYKHSVNPQAYISEEMVFPPILLVTSEGDVLFKYQTYLLADFFNKMNISYDLFIEKSKSAFHVYNVSNPSDDLAQKCNQMMLDFFENSLQHRSGD